MLLNNIKLAFRNLVKNKVYSSINIVGFAFSIAVFLMISIYLIHENSFDKYHEKADFIYRLVDSENNSSKIDYRVSEVLYNNFPEVNNSCFVQIANREVDLSYNNEGHYIKSIMSVDNNYFKIFSSEFLEGNSENPLPTINSAIITESTSRKIFGEENPIGKELFLGNEKSVIISNIIKDLPNNSSMKADLIVNADNDDFKFSFSCGDYNDINSHRYPFNIYFEIKKNTDINELLTKLNLHSDLFQRYITNIEAISLKEMYMFDTTIGADIIKGNPFLLNLMLMIALIILGLAIINYTNLTIAQRSKMNKHVGIKQIVGARRSDIVAFFMIESTLISIIAFSLGIIFVQIGLPIFNKIVDNSLSTTILFQFPYNIFLVIFVLIIGLLSGVVPSIILSSIKPINLIRNSLITKRKSTFRNVLTVFQFSVSIALIFCIIIIYKQISFVKNQNVGFGKEQLLRIDNPPTQRSNSNIFHALNNELRQFHGIQSISLSSGVPGFVNNHMGFGEKGVDGSAAIIFADFKFLNTFKIKQIMGRELLKGDLGKVCMMNKMAFEHYGWTDLENRRFNNGQAGGYEVIGVIEDFNFTSLHSSVEPLILLFTDVKNPSHINVRIAGGKIGETMNFINKTWKELASSYPLKYEFYDDWFDSLYRNEERLAKTVGLFAFLAILISSLGILGLSIFTTENSRKEIGIRKVYGAKVRELILMLNLDYLKWVIMAFIIAVPIAWLIMEDWLEGFAFRTEISWWVFLISALSSVSIAILTVSWQTYKAATANPVESLRSE